MTILMATHVPWHQAPKFATLASATLLLTLLLSYCTSLGDARSTFGLVAKEKRDCDIYANEALHAILDKLCGDCNELFRHELPDLHAKCRRNCFENNVFHMCWQAINPSDGAV